jgi:hypothetical protein
LKVGPATVCIARAANFAGLLAWRVNSAPLAGLCAAFPRRGLNFQHFAAVTCAVSIPPYSRASATAFLSLASIRSRGNKCNPIEVARLPVHEVRDDCEGPKPTVDDDMPRFRHAAPGLTKKHLRCWQQIHTRTTVRAFLDRERRLKNLF